MRTSALFASAIALATQISASPIAKRQNDTASSGITDTLILQFALTLEHLENNFYTDALAKYDAAAFEAAGFPEWVRGRISQIQEHEQSHVDVLSGALGADAVQPCNYSFPYTDPRSFVGLAKIIENVGVSAYLGAAHLITDPAYITVAGSILTTEARHQSWISSSGLMGPPWSGPYDTPAGPNVIYTAAAQFITGCPSSNPSLPFMPYPALTFDGSKVSFTGLTGNGQYAVLYQGLDIATYPIGSDGSVSIPATQGIAYLTVSTEQNATMVTDQNIIAGPAVIDTPFDSSAMNPAPSFTSA